LANPQSQLIRMIASDEKVAALQVELKRTRHENHRDMNASRQLIDDARRERNEKTATANTIMKEAQSTIDSNNINQWGWAEMYFLIISNTYRVYFNYNTYRVLHNKAVVVENVYCFSSSSLLDWHRYLILHQNSEDDIHICHRCHRRPSS
jgi:hypothetical protein